MLTEKPSASRSVIEALRGLYANFLVQEFIAEAKGADLRCFVVGGKVVAAMRRQAPKGDFRSNLHRGGTRQGRSAASADEQDAAVRAAAVLGLGVAGVDLMRSQPRPAGAGGQFLARAWKASRRRPASISPAASSTTWCRGRQPSVAGAGRRA